jgi:hypothetical protein
MIKDPKHVDETEAPGHLGNSGQMDHASSKEGKEEKYQRSRDQAPVGEQTASDPDNNLGRGTPRDREDRIRQRAHEIWEAEGRPEGQADRHWSRAAEDLDREDAAFRPQGDADFVRDKS